MGDARRKMVAQRRLFSEGRSIDLDMSQVAWAASEADHRILNQQSAGSSTEIIMARMLISAVVAASYPEGMGRKEGRLWAGWQEVLSASEETKMKVTAGQLEWLRDKLTSESLKLPVGMAQWREALCDYFDEVTAAINRPADTAAAT